MQEKEYAVKFPLRSNAGKKLNPTRVIALGFGMIILLGTLLLHLPVSARDGQWTSWLDCLFTATSATCVTGLARVDTALHWSGFGQLVILFLIQLGGLGFVTVISLVSLAMGRRIGLGQRMMLASAMNMDQTAGVVRVVRHALIGTFLIEGAGALLLAVRFVPLFGWGKGLWFSIFHSISAFCNGGFDLMGGYSGSFTSMSAFQNDWFVLTILIFLIVVAGLGFFVWEDIWEKRRWKTLTLYSKLVLGISGGLILVGWALILWMEWNNPATLGTLSVPDKLLNALFQSVTLRTAGFAAIDQAGLTDSTAVLSIVWMLIGGSSGSTAGGMKTVTAGVLLLFVWSRLRGEERVVLHGRTIPERKVLDGVVLLLVVLFLFLTGSMMLALTDSLPFVAASYEVASALATVGLSMGATPLLSVGGCLMIILFMFLGRVGVLSFSIAFLTCRGSSKLRYPDADIMIG